MLNYSIEKFKSLHKDKKNVILFYSVKTDGKNEILNLINNFLMEKNSFIFESVEKGVVRGRYTIFGKNPDKIWEFNNNSCFQIKKNIKYKIKGKPKKIIEKIIENFNFKIPKVLPPLSSILAGYFSYDIIRYIEKIPNKNRNDLNIPDVRILRPKTLIIHDNLKKKIYYLVNVFKDEKIFDYKKKYIEIQSEIENLIFKSHFKINKKKK